MIRLLLVVLLVACGVVSAPADESRRLLPLPDVLGYQPLRADLHLHSVFSDGEVWPTVHVREAWRDGLDVVALSEHREYQPHAQDLAGGAMRAFDVAAPLAARLGLLLVPAVEITRPVPGQPSEWPVGSAHFNALFVTDERPFGAPDLGAALDAARAQDAFVFWNHPSFMGRPARWFPHVAALHERGLFAGVEVVNGDDYSPEAFAWALERRLTILACSDAHLPMPAHLRSARRPITILFARTRDLAGVRDALADRRTVAWLDDRLWGEEAWLRGLWEGAVHVPAEADAQAGRDFVVAVENRSALDFQVEIAETPGWMTLQPSRLPRQAVTLLEGRLRADAPAGQQRAVLGVRVTNLHPRPAQALDAQLAIPLTIAP